MRFDLFDNMYANKAYLQKHPVSYRIVNVEFAFEN